jgi:hypothetical protein
MFTAARHRGCSQRADLGAVHIQGDATRHCPDVLLVQTRRRAVIACNRTGIAGLYAGVKFLLDHIESPEVADKTR